MSEFGFISNEEVRKKLMGSRGRISRAYDELFSGYDRQAEDVLNNVIQVDDYPGIVSVKDISFYTFCEHHFLPFFGKAEIAYQPNKIITGLGKLVRLIRDVHAPRLQIQETMARDIAEDLSRVLNAKGVFVKLTAQHLCMCSRGPNDDTSYTDVEYGIGTLKNTLYSDDK